MAKPKYKRILLKISGEVLMGSEPFGIDLKTVGRVADEVIACTDSGAEVALVIGGGLTCPPWSRVFCQSWPVSVEPRKPIWR